MKEKFEYFLNAVHYMIYKEQVWSSKKIQKTVNYLISIIIKIPFIGKYKKENNEQELKELNKFYYGKKSGLSISVAHHLFGTFYSGYSMFWSWLLIGVINKIYSPMHVRGIVALIILGVPLTIGYLPAYKAVFSHDRYLSFFKQFERKKKKWYRKWKIRSIIFCASGIIAAVLGFLLMVAIEHL